MAKKLLLLGGSHYLIPVIEAAHELDCYVITMDYLPENIAHKFSDEYIDVSIIDKETVLEEARKLQIDGVMSFACDPGVVTAAYVAEEMGLPFQCSYESACILQDKGRFRQFLLDHKFNSPFAKRYEGRRAPVEDADLFEWPVIVKPVDSAGSKGVTKVDAPEMLQSAVDEAFAMSYSDSFIVEEFLIFEGYHSSADLFSIDGRLAFTSFSDQLFDEDADNPYTPAKIIWPSTMSDGCQAELAREIQRLFDLLGMRTGIYNVESCVASGGKPYIMEVSPRGGGCKIAELQRLAYGVDLIKAEVAKAIGLPVEGVEDAPCDGHWCELVVHAAPGQSGVLESVELSAEVEREYLAVKDIVAQPGDAVEPFTGANMALGDLFLRFESRETLDKITGDVSSWLEVRLRKGEESKPDPNIAGGGRS